MTAFVGWFGYITAGVLAFSPYQTAGWIVGIVTTLIIIANGILKEGE